jgi:hypothetical protein
MKVLLTGIFPIWQAHFIAECNYIEEHLEAGDEVYLLECDASLNSCDANPKQSLLTCATCIGSRQSSVNLLSRKIQKLPIFKQSVLKSFSGLSYQRFNTFVELLNFEFQGIEVGKNIFSSLVTATGSPSFNPRKHESLINKSIKDYLAVYRSAIDYLKIYRFDLVYLFNGRFIAPRAWLRACEVTKTDYISHERLGMPNQVFKIKNGSVHNTLQYSDLIKGFWSRNSSNEEIRNEAIDFFEERPRGKLTGWFSFVSDQKVNSLPVNWEAQKRNLALFASTDSEFAGLPECFTGAPFQDQKLAYLEISKIFQKKYPEFHFYLRIHPNSRIEKDHWWDDPELHACPNLTIIDPPSPISSYELLMKCEKTITFMSTIGIEATYWGKPSIILSNAMYKGIGVVYEPQNIDELVNYLLIDNLQPKSKDAALAYGAFIRCGGEKLKHSQALDHCKLTFKGIRPNAPDSVIHALWQWENHINKPWVPKWMKKIWERHEFNKLWRSVLQ